MTRAPALTLASASAFAAALLCGAPALAKPMIGTPGSRFGERPSNDYQSSQRFAFELKLSPYSPKIDQSPGLGGRTPFNDLYPGTPYQLLTQLEFDYQFLHKFGSLGVGLSAGFYRRTTHSFNYLDPTGAMACTAGVDCVRSGDETALNIVPLSLMLVYRLDVLALRYRVPLVPYLKVGLAYYVWFIQNGAGSIASYQGDSGAGGTWGYVVHPGLAFLLDVIDPSSARTIDVELGINHTYLFCELNYADISGFGRANQMVLSDIFLNAGLAFEF